MFTSKICNCSIQQLKTNQENENGEKKYSYFDEHKSDRK